MYIYRQPTLTMQWNFTIFAQILYSYFRYTGRLFLGCAFFIACCNYQNFVRNQEGKNELQKKVHRRICVRNITFLTVHSPFNVFLLLSLYILPPPSQVTPLQNDPYKDIYFAMCGILCVIISWVNGRKYENLLQFTTTCFFYKQCFFSTHPQLSVA